LKFEFVLIKEKRMNTIKALSFLALLFSSPYQRIYAVNITTPPFSTCLTRQLNDPEIYISNGQSNPLKAIIVGASTGIGREVVKVLASNGYEVGLCSRKIELLKVLQQEIPTKTYAKQIDLMDIDMVQQNLQELVTAMGGLDLIVVNSGAWPELAGGLCPEDKYFPFEWIADTINVNVLGCSAAFNFATNYFLKQNHGHIVGISSLDAVRGTAIAPAYCASKSFIATFLEGLRNKFSQLNIPIDVTEIRPGWIQTWDPAVEVVKDSYWIVSKEVAAEDIYQSIVDKDKVAYVPRRWQLIAWLLMITPDWLYNWIGGF
jgi:short-subunit dehydrogenase